MPPAAFGHVSTYPVKGICIEGVIGVLPICFSRGLKADLPDCEDVAFLLSLLPNLKQEMKCKTFISSNYRAPSTIVS